MSLFDPNPCRLGEGPLWHPKRASLIWFDILNKTMFERRGHTRVEWHFEEHVSAAGWLDPDTILMASETGLWQFDLGTAARDLIVPLEAENAVTRSNDGRADPWGGFWIGTMGKALEPNAGAIYRYYQGELRQLVPDITISNAICFAPDRSCAYFADTPTQQIMRIALDPATGWPTGTPEICIDLRADGVNPDGAVTDAQGNLWIALWGAARVACYDPQGRHLRDAPVTALQPTCPAFGGTDLRDLIVTSANDGLIPIDGDSDGMTLIAADTAQGLPEPQVIL